VKDSDLITTHEGKERPKEMCCKTAPKSMNKEN